MPRIKTTTKVIRNGNLKIQLINQTIRIVTATSGIAIPNIRYFRSPTFGSPNKFFYLQRPDMIWYVIVI